MVIFTTLFPWLRRHGLFVLPLFLLLLLLAKNPFSERTLIPNFEPFPDAFHYVVPPLQLVKGEVFQLGREGRGFAPHVPFLYPIVLLPAFFLAQDPRMFYVVNVGLALISLALFYRICLRLFHSSLLASVLSTFFVSSYLVYWIAELAMAENLAMPVFLAWVYLLLLPKTRKVLVGIGLACAAMYMTKYASVLAMVSAVAASTMAVLRLRTFSSKRQAMIIVLTCILAVSSMTVLEQFTRGFSALGTYIQGGLAFLTSMLGSRGSFVQASESSAQGFFSIRFIWPHFMEIWRWLHGDAHTVLWTRQAFVPVWLGVGGLMGLMLGSLLGARRFFFGGLLVVNLAQTLFISFFSGNDGRYVTIWWPTILLGFGFLVVFVWSWLLHTTKSYFFRAPLPWAFLCACILGGWLLFAGQQIRAEVALNLKYAETPWYYLATKRIDAVIAGHAETPRPILITAMIPFLFDFYAKTPMQLLPLSLSQEFPTYRQQVWGAANYSSLEKLYLQKLNEGREIFITNYGLGNEVQLNQDFANIQKQFSLQLVEEGCYSLCNVYRLQAR